MVARTVLLTVAHTVLPTVALTMARTMAQSVLTVLTVALTVSPTVALALTVSPTVALALAVFPMVALALAVFPTVALAVAVFPTVAHVVFPRVPYALRVAHAVLLQVLDLEVFPLKAFALTKRLPMSPIKKTLKISLVVNLKVLTVTSDRSVVEDSDLTVVSSDLVAVLTMMPASPSVSLNATLVLEVDSVISEISRTEQDASVQTLTLLRTVFAMVAIANSVAMVAVAQAPTLRTLLKDVLAMFKVLEVVVLMANVAVAPSELLVAIKVLEASVSLSVVLVVVALAVTLSVHLPFPISVVVDLAPLS